MEKQDSQLGLKLVPQTEIESFNDQDTLFLEGYATCLNDLLEVVNSEDEHGAMDLKTARIVMKTWLYLCSNIVTKRLSSIAQA
jgi:hypothetical protein